MLGAEIGVYLHIFTLFVPTVASAQPHRWFLHRQTPLGKGCAARAKSKPNVIKYHLSKLAIKNKAISFFVPLLDGLGRSGVRQDPTHLKLPLRGHPSPSFHLSVTSTETQPDTDGVERPCDS